MFLYGKIETKGNIQNIGKIRKIVKIKSIWLESSRKYIPISLMSPNHVQTGGSPELIFKKESMNPFASFQLELLGVPKKMDLLYLFKIS